MGNLVDRLLAAIERAEGDAPDLHRDGCPALLEQDPLDRQPCTCGVPKTVLDRCAADRVLVNIVRHVMPDYGAALSTLARIVIRQLADGYDITETEEAARVQ